MCIVSRLPHRRCFQKSYNLAVENSALVPKPSVTRGCLHTLYALHILWTESSSQCQPEVLSRQWFWGGGLGLRDTWPNCLKHFINQCNTSKMEAKGQNWETFSGNVWKHNQDHLPFLVETTSFVSVGIMVAVKHFDVFLTSHHLHITIRHMHLLLSSAAKKLPFKQ